MLVVERDGYFCTERSQGYMQKIGKNGIFTQNFELLRHEMIAEWFLERGVRVE